MTRFRSLIKSIFVGLSVLIFCNPLLGAAEQVFSAGAGLAAEKISYLQSKQLPAQLEQHFDAYFSNEEVQALISELYCADSNSKVRKAQDGLELLGFIFLGEKPHVFTHVLFPEWVFKIALPLGARTEALNASRIWFADKIRAAAYKHNLRILVPQKFAYFLPLPQQADIGKFPRLIVVAQKLDLTNATPRLSKILRKHLKILEEELDYFDVHEDNVVKVPHEGQNVAMILDTEQHTNETVQEVLKFEELNKFKDLPLVDRIWIQAMEHAERLKNGLLDNVMKAKEMVVV